jgi:hypothetical protein
MQLPDKELPLRDIHRWPIPYDRWFFTTQLEANMPCSKQRSDFPREVCLRLRTVDFHFRVCSFAVIKKKQTNPFYALLVVVGIAFCITATSYGVLTLRDMRGTGNYYGLADEQTDSEISFMRFVDENAVRLMIGELVILAIATVGAIGTDSYWTGHSEQNNIQPRN